MVLAMLSKICWNSHLRTSGMVRCLLSSHCNFTSKDHGAACSSCNGKMRNPSYMFCFFHNLKRFDGHLLTRAIMHLQMESAGCSNASPDAHNSDENEDNDDADDEQHYERKCELQSEASDGEGINKNNEHSPGNSTTIIEYAKFAPLARNSEKSTQIRFGPVVFKNSLKFMDASLDAIIKVQNETVRTLAECFPITMQHHPFLRNAEGERLDEIQLEERLQLMCKKLPFPYSSMTSK